MKNIVIEPWITEKSMDLASRGWFTFVVSKDSQKNTIAQAVEDEFKVHVTKVRTISLKGKTKRVGKQRLIKKAKRWKKALVRLKDNEKIDLFAVETPPVKEK